jgi:hypothetical protein
VSVVPVSALRPIVDAWVAEFDAPEDALHALATRSDRGASSWRKRLCETEYADGTRGWWAEHELHADSVDELIAAMGMPELWHTDLAPWDEPRNPRPLRLGREPAFLGLPRAKRRRVKARNSNAKLSQEQIRAAYVLYRDGGLSLNIVAAKLWRAYGYASADSCRRCLLHGFQLQGYKLRSRAAADKLRAEPKNTAGLRRHHAAVRAQTHCKHGHLLAGDNLYVFPKTGYRACRTCRRRRNRERRQAA